MKKKEKTKTVKAWAIISARGKLVPYEVGVLSTYQRKVNAEWDSYTGERIVPCTITYEVPEHK